MKNYIIFFFLVFSLHLQAQDIPVHISDKAIYDFMEEMASEKLITINDVVKPMSRKAIAMKLLSIDQAKLNTRQEKELSFYIASYRLELGSNRSYRGDVDLYRPNAKSSFSIFPSGYFYADSLSSFRVNPIWGIQYWSNNQGTMFHRWGGLSGQGTYKNFGFYASLRDNHESQQISRPLFLNNRIGANYKGTDYSEMRGGFTYAKDWISIGLVKDHFEWGTNYHGSTIFSAKQPSFAHLKLDITPWKWFDFHYVHGWLVSNVVDSTRSYVLNNGDRRDVMHKKYLAANLFSFHPWKSLDLSIGNAIIYSDVAPNPAYLIPFLFYKSVDHTYNATDKVGRNVGQNSQMFYDVSFRGIKHLHLYFSQFIDELKVARISDPDEYNFINTKAGFKLSNWPLKNLALTYEFTRTLPVTYQHDISTTTYESNNYNLGHYLRDNSKEHYVSLAMKPIKNVSIVGEYILALKGEEYGYDRSSKELTRHPFIEEEKWRYQALNLDIRYQPFSGVYLFTGIHFSNTSGDDLLVYTPSYFAGKQTSLTFGFNIGF